ncbi:hypothetical protein AMK26_07200 [Streptomyces sp. CB03234]|uniref:hypothetical protein n=1 Tax=Streptomyces sp. (strain CB03234) TaxID=1703937 RepID=UPI00093C1DB0|nr:hypothetical protein [Streptomyces sp. CB03234]OKK06894.1 hypothetical protein AMK26_07200 [Streptomyces sp. CB03234]
MHRKPLITALGLVSLASMALATAPSPGQADSGAKSRHAQLTRAYQATEKYRDESRAIKDGYVRTNDCVYSSEGGMGYHYVKEAHINSTDPARPAALLYEPGPGGKRRLVAVEYVTIDRDQDLATDPDRPRMFGRGLNGPMAGHAPGMPNHYDLHVWLHKKNPKGLMADWNPTVRCPGDE